MKITGLKRTRVWLPLLVAVLLLVAVFFGFKNLTGPAEGTVTSPPPDSNPIKNQGTANKTYHDKYVSFNYPSKYEAVPAEKDKLYLDTVDLIKSEHKDQFVAVAIIREDFNSDSGLTYRRQHPDLYKPVSQTDNSAVFAKNDSTEYTGFMAHNGMVISISLTTVAPADLSADYNQIANSLEWKQ